MPEPAIQDVREEILGLLECDSVFVESVPGRETFREQVVWDGAVVVFDLVGHPTATRPYAWSNSVDGWERRRLVAVLHSPPGDSPQSDVGASIAAEHRRG